MLSQRVRAGAHAQLGRAPFTGRTRFFATYSPAFLSWSVAFFLIRAPAGFVYFVALQARPWFVILLRGTGISVYRLPVRFPFVFESNACWERGDKLCDPEQQRIAWVDLRTMG